MIRIIYFLSCLLLGFVSANAQSTVTIPDQKEVENTSETWLGMYTKYRINEKLFYYGEYHLRRREFMDKMAQVYLRFAMTYLLKPKVEVTGGIVTPFYWAKESSAENQQIDKVVPQFRFWQQILFVQNIDRVKLYHQIRTEQRWKRDYVVGSPFVLDFRFRYKISTYVPLNRPTLVSNTVFFSGYSEIFIQAGRKVIYNHFEDFRLFLGLGYIFNQNWQVQAGYMWTYRHAGSPFKYENRHIPRLSFYHNLDFHTKKQERLQRERARHILQDEF